MERLMQKESDHVYIGYSSSLKVPESEDMDFNDVFGGPPRRFSMQEARERYSFGESSSEEKPVFGDERRRRKGADFFDDIFKGSPRRSDRDRDSDVFGSNTGSRIMSPASRPFSPKSDALGSSLPAQFSLPAKSTKAMDLPTFHGLNSPHSSSPFSRFSNEATRSVDGMMKDEVNPFSRQRPFSDETDDSPFNDFSDKKETIENLNKKRTNVDSIGDQFHFSIYKWEGRGVPMLMPLVTGNNLKEKDSMKYEKSSSYNGRMQEKNYINDSVVFNLSVTEEQLKPVHGSNEGDKIEKESPVKISFSRRLHAFLDEGNIAKTKDKKAKAPVVHGDAHDKKEVKEKDSKVPDLKGADTNFGAAEGKSATAKGKVKEFVEIFNKETDSSSINADVWGSRRRGDVGIDQKGDEVMRTNQEEVKENVKLHNVDKKPEKEVKVKVKLHNVDKDVSFKVVENLKNNEAQRISPKSTSSSSTRSSSRLRKSFSEEILHVDIKMSEVDFDDTLEDNFEVHELSDVHEYITQNESSMETKAIDAKIRQWSVGKKGNIRSLLSTLQYVLWPESGWKAVPLVDLIEANSVKKAYQKALLRLHPDKLQQKGAAFHHKYTAEKVFDILQEAWDHFNTSSIGM